MKIGPDGQVRPDDPIAAANLTMRIATREIEEVVVADLMTLAEFLEAWGERRIDYRDVMRGFQIETVEGLIDAAFHSQTPFGPGERAAAIGTAERIFREDGSERDRMLVIMALIRREISIADIPAIQADPTVITIQNELERHQSRFR